MKPVPKIALTPWFLIQGLNSADAIAGEIETLRREAAAARKDIRDMLKLTRKVENHGAIG